MAERQKPTAQELAWLTHDPPRGQQQELVPWTLSDRAVNDERWTRPIEHVDLTLERVDFTAVQWEDAVFRRCLIRDTEFIRTTFVRARFEDVVFERCRFEEANLANCELLRCRFEACEIEFSGVRHGSVRECVLDRPAVKVLDLRECDLTGTLFVEAKIEALRASKVSADTLELRQGRLVGSDLTACKVRTLQFVGVEIDGLRIIDSFFERAALSGAIINDVSLATSEARVLAFFDCPELGSLRVLESIVGELRLEACEAAPNLLVADSSVTSVILRDTTLYDAAFERVEAGSGSRMTGGALTGVLFSGGSWAGFDVSKAGLNEYAAVLGTHFENLRFSTMQVSDPLSLRLEGDDYGAGSMTWSDARGA